jgi:hypothetical protein
MKILAFFGHQGAGKSESAKAVASLPGWVRISFADPLYAMMSALLGTDARSLPKHEPLDGLCGRTLREGLQFLGTEWGRGMIGQTIWLDAMDRELAKHAEAGMEGVVIDDLRFANEYGFLFRRHAKFVKVERDGVIGAIGTHSSEVDWVRFHADAVVENYGTAEELREKAILETSRP